MKRCVAILICLLASTLFACGNDYPLETEVEVLSAEEGDQLASEFEISYEKIEYTPNVMTNQFGYEMESKKYVFFRGEELSDSFQVFEQGTDTLVYEGVIEFTKEEGYAVGDFTDLKQEGRYYIQTAKIGESYPFSILVERQYDQVYRMLIESFSKQAYSRYQSIEHIQELFPILLAHEMYPTAFFDGDIYETPNGIPDVIDYLYEVSEVRLQEESSTEVSELFLEAAFFGKLSYAMEDYDETIAYALNSQAKSLYEQAESLIRKDAEQGDFYVEAYFAATELYRLNGGYAYKSECQLYADGILDNALENPNEFYADMTLMSTRRSVEVKFCNARMEALRAHIVEWNEESGDYVFFYPTEDISALLNHGIKVLWMLSLDYNEEYANFSDEILDYVTGLNVEGLSYIPEIGYTVSDEALLQDLQLNNQYLLIISRYMQQEEQEQN